VYVEHGNAHREQRALGLRPLTTYLKSPRRKRVWLVGPRELRIRAAVSTPPERHERQRFGVGGSIRDLPLGTIRVMADHGHVEIGHLDELTTRMPTPEEARALDLGTGVPVLIYARAAYTKDRPVRLTEARQLLLVS